jgi:nucleoside-triphosphatase THEP1
MLGYITVRKKGATDRLLTDVARHLQSRNIPMAGAIQVDKIDTQAHRAEMNVELLGTGEIIKISQNLGPFAKGCQLNSEALEIAAYKVFEALDGSERVLILNKFGKQERDGQGFRDVIVKALDLDVPVLLGVNESLVESFVNFAGEFAHELPVDLEKITSWVLET